MNYLKRRMFCPPHHVRADRLAANVAAFVNTYGFDGVDLYWEASINTYQYISFISKLRAALPAGKLITMHVGEWGGRPSVVSASYTNLDQVNVMCFDMDYDSYALHNAALLRRYDEARL